MIEITPIMWILLSLVGFIVLNEGAKFLTDNAAAVAKTSGHGRFVIGMLLVSSLTALPEVLVSLIALHEGSPDIAMGNAISSNVVTISFVIGLSAIILPLSTNREIVLRDILFLTTVTVVASALLLDGDLTNFEGLALISLFIPYTVNLLLAKKVTKPEEIDATLEDIRIELEFTGVLFGKRLEIRAGIAWLVFGILWTVMGAQFVVRSSIELSRILGISQWMMGITIVALGTSLPDIAASFHATKKGYSDLALGEGIGANIVTTLLTLGSMGILRPTTYTLSVTLPMIVSMNIITFLLLFLMMYNGKWKITRKGGILLLSIYFVTILLYILFH